MKWYLNSGSASHLYANGFFTKKLKEHDAKSFLIIADHHPLGSQQSYDRLLKNEPEIANIVSPTYYNSCDHNNGKYRISDFNSVYITGGLYELWDKNVVNKSGENFENDLRGFILSESGCYFGSSVGLQILFDKFHSRMEKNEEHESIWYENGLGIIKHILTEVHYDGTVDEFNPDKQLS